MKCILRGYGMGMSTQERFNARAQARDMTFARGTGQTPGAPRDVFVQAGPRGVLLNWRPPAGFVGDIGGWRVYKDNELSLFCEIRDPSTTQHFVDTSAGSLPPVTNFFISTINKLGEESPLVQAQASSKTEAGAPTMPGTPPSFGQNFGGKGGGAGGRGSHSTE